MKNRKKIVIIILSVLILITIFFFGVVWRQNKDSNKSLFGVLTHQIKGNQKDIKRSYRDIKFIYKGTGAKIVKISGEFNDWEEEAMTKEGDLNWVFTKRLDKNTEYAYLYNVDGSFLQDPDNPEVIQRGIKGKCSLILRGITDLYLKKVEDNNQQLYEVKSTNVEEKKQKIYGKVTDVDNKPIEGVTIKVSRSGKEVLRTITSDEGKYELNEISEGIFDVKAWEKSYKDKTVTIELKANSNIELNFILKKL